MRNDLQTVYLMKALYPECIKKLSKFNNCKDNKIFEQTCHKKWIDDKHVKRCSVEKFT